MREPFEEDREDQAVDEPGYENIPADEQPSVHPLFDELLRQFVKNYDNFAKQMEGLADEHS